MLIVGLVIGILIVAFLIFVILKSVVTKIFTMTLVVLALVLTFALSTDKIQQYIKPIEIDQFYVQIYDEENKPVKFKIEDVRRVDVVKKDGGKVAITFVVKGFSYTVTMSKISYEWSLKNPLNKLFNGKLYDSTY